MQNKRLILERLEERILLAADPVAAVEVADTNFINEDINFTVSFDNDPNPAGTDVGFQPHLDVVVEKGIEVSSASYLGSGVTLNQVAFWDVTDSQWEDAADGSGNEVTEHPQDPTGLGGFSLPGAGSKTGDVWYSIQLPFGSFAHDQPKVAIDFTATLDSAEGAVVGTPLAIKATGNFAFGSDALNNPGTDAPLQGAEVSASITPTVWTIDKTIIAPEGETATGPSFPRTWKIEIDIANGQTVTDIDITDVLPNNLVYVDSSIAINTTGAIGQTITQIPTSGQVNNAPDNDFLIEFGSVTGTTAKDIVITYQAYVNNLDADGGNVINPATGDDTNSINNASADGSYLGNALAQITDTETLQDKSIAIQKSVAIVGGGSTIPGAFAEYTLEFQISDYFSFDDLVIDDSFSDGLRFDNSFTPTFTVTENGTAVATTTFGPGNFTVTLNADNNPATPASDGSTDVQFRLSDQLTGTTVGAELSGDQFNSAEGSGGTVGTIKFRVEIQEDFSDTFISGDNSVDMGDVLTNTVTITGDVKNANGTDTGSSESDDSTADLTIDQIQATKAIYAIDSNTGFTNVALTPGDTVTYRIKVDLASADAENLIITDFLPLPVLTATTVAANTFAAAPSGTVPVAGSASFGPDHTLHNANLVRDNGAVFNGIPTINTNGTNNTVQFDFGTFDDNGIPSGPQVIDILFTVVANDEPFGDGLFLTNQALVGIGSTNGSTDAITEIVQIEVEEPELVLKKGIVSTNAGASSFNPGTVGPVVFDSPNDPSQPFAGAITSAGLATNPIDSNLTGVDAEDLVKFAVVLENTGQEGAFDLLFSDQLPDGFELPSLGQGLNFRVFNGAGVALTFVDETGAALANDAAIAAKYFSTVPGEGIRINDSANGAIAAGEDSNGTANSTGDNIIIITYDLQAKTDINPATVHTGTAELVEYSVQEAGNDFTAGNTGPWDDPATITALSPATPDKTLIGTGINITNNSNTQAVIGETVQYSVTITLPEGETPVAQLRDILDDGLTFVSLDTITASGNVNSSVGALTTVNKAAFNPIVTPNAQEELLFNFGTLTNTNTDNSTAETITLTYTVQVENISANQQDDTLNNQARFQWDTNNNGAAGDASNEFTASDSASNVTVIEPLINTSVSAVVNGSGTEGDVGDSVVYTLILTSEAGRPEVFDATFTDAIPSDITINPGGVTVVHSVDGNLFTGGGTGDFELSGNTIQTVPGNTFDLAEGETVTITVTGTLASTVSAGQTITNSATTEWTSIDGAGPNTSGNADGERVGAGGVNDYAVTESVDVIIAAPADKSIVFTSESHTGFGSNAENLAIGEIVRYRLQFKLPESTSNNVILKDNLPDGLKFLNDGTAKVAFIANGGGISSTDPAASAGESWLVAPGALINGNSIVSPTFVLADENISISVANNNDSYTSGTDIYFKLGNLTNTDSDSDAEYVVVEFNAIALNNPGSNDAGDTHDNNFELLVNGASVTTSSIVTTRIVEPLIENLSKTVTATPSDAGDTITYQYTFSNTASGNGAAAAFDINLTDTLDSNLDLLNISDVTFSTTGAGSFTNNSDATTEMVNIILDQLNPGESATITVVATVKVTAPAGVDISSTANLAYTSLSGTGSITPGASGADDGERNGSASIVANDYNDNDTVTTTLTTPIIDQLQPTPAEYAIGDIVTYDIVVTLPEGETKGLQVSDALPPGLSFVGSQIITTVGGSGGVLTNDFNGTVTSPAGTSTGGSGDDVSWNFADTTTTNNNNANDNQFIIRVTALVENEVGNQDATVLTTDAGISWTNPNNSNTDSFNDPTDPVVTIVEPVLTVNTSTSGVPAIPNIGDTFQFITSVDHTGASTATANDLQFTDTMPPELAIISIDSVGGTNSLGLTPADFTINGGGSGWTLNPGFDLVLADDFTLTYTVEILSTINLNQGLSNDVDISWDSVDGADSNARDGSDGPSGALNDYAATANAAITTNNISISKIISDTDQVHTNGNDVVIGEIITYELTINLSETTTNNVVVNDILPEQLSYIVGSLNMTTGNTGMTTQFIDENTSSSYDPTTRVITVNLGNINNPDNSNTTDDKVILRYQAVVENDISNQSPEVKPNNVTVTSDGGLATDTTGAVILEPDLEISLAVSDKTPIINETIQYTLTVDHTSASGTDAFDLTLTNLLADPDLTITGIDSVGGTNSAGLNVGDFVITPDGSGIVFASPGTLDIGLTDDFTLNFSVKVSGDPASIGNVNDTSVNISWSSIDGENSNERDGTGGVNDYNATTNQNVTLIPVPPKSTLPVFVFDASHNDAEEDDEDSFFQRGEERLFTLPPLPIFPIFSGATEPGTTLNFKLYNEAGAEIGSQTVMADTGGNWLASFPGNIMFDQPHSMRVEQTASVVSIDGANGFNLRTYFSPAMNEQLFFSHAYNVDTVFSNTASTSLQAIHQGLNNPFNLGSGDFYAYEYLSSSSTTTQGH